MVVGSDVAAESRHRDRFGRDIDELVSWRDGREKVGEVISHWSANYSAIFCRADRNENERKKAGRSRVDSGGHLDKVRHLEA